MEDTACPLCTEELDPTDCLLASRLCHCRFAVCLWCFRRITEDAAKDSRPALCPNCREPYDVERIAREGRELNPEQLEEAKRKKGKPEEKRKPAAAARPRKDLANVRVVQRNLVYVVGLPMDSCYEETLSSSEYIGQFGRIVKISVSRSGPYGSSAAKHGPTGSAYITFKRSEDARRCIESIHGTSWEGKLVKACYGTTKYCNAFLKGLPCNNSDCLYLHDVAADDDSYTKEETKSTRFVNLVHAASLSQAPAVAGGQLAGAPSGEPLGLEAGQRAGSHEPELVSSAEDEHMDGGGWPSLQGTAWAGKAAAAAAAPSQAVPPTGDARAWPGLPGAGGGGGGSSAEVSEAEGDARPPLGRAAMSMADKLARGGPAPGAKPEARKKLTPLSARGKAAAAAVAAAAAEAGEGRAAPRDRPSPPRTPQPLQKAPSVPEQQPGAAAAQRAATGSSSGAAEAGRPAAELGSVVGPKPPPSFAGVKPKVPLPPGFSHPAAAHQAQAAHATIAGSSGAPLHAIWGAPLDAACARPANGAPPGYELPLAPPQPRARSRFHFANDGEPSPPRPPQPQLAQPPFPGAGPPAFGGGYAAPAPPPGFLGVQPWAQPNGGAPAAANGGGGGGEAGLPAGLLLLRKLQAQGGVARARSGSSDGGGLPHAPFQDPAILSARGGADQGGPQRAWLDDFGTSRAAVPEATAAAAAAAEAESRAAPKTPPRRRKGKAAS